MIKIVEYEENTLPIVRELFVEYAEQLGVDLCFQGFQKELETLPYLYARPNGTILLAKLDDEFVGVVALKPLEAHTCEMKRLYVKESAREHKIGKELAIRILEKAKEIGYETMKLDTLKRLSTAVSMYQKMGFIETQPYNYNPESDIIYMEKAL